MHTISIKHDHEGSHIGINGEWKHKYHAATLANKLTSEKEIGVLGKMPPTFIALWIDQKIQCAFKVSEIIHEGHGSPKNDESVAIAHYHLGEEIGSERFLEIFTPPDTEVSDDG